MDALERLFYAVSATAALFALLIFGMYFNLGDMVLAAVRGPGALQEWATRRNSRAAEAFGLGEEIKPDETKRKTYFVPRELDGSLPYQAYNGPPPISVEKRMKEERMYLVSKGFTDQDFLEMETLFRADRRHLRQVVTVDQLVMRGDALSALDHLEKVIASIDPKNKRALLDLLVTRRKLMTQLEATPDQMFDHLMEEIETRIAIFKLEIRGYRGIPRFQRELAHAEAGLRQSQELRASYQSNRSQVMHVFRSGLWGGKKLDPSTGQKLIDGFGRFKDAGKISDADHQSLTKMVETQVSRWQVDNRHPDEG